MTFALAYLLVGLLISEGCRKAGLLEGRTETPTVALLFVIMFWFPLLVWFAMFFKVKR